jgi:hypothetical protein
LVAKRTSSRASAISKTSRPRIAWSQNAHSRGVWVTPSMPTFALNHWRVSSISVTSAIGVTQMDAASRTSASYTASGEVSNTPYARKARIRASSCLVSTIVERTLAPTG